MEEMEEEWTVVTDSKVKGRFPARDPQAKSSHKKSHESSRVSNSSGEASMEWTRTPSEPASDTKPLDRSLLIGKPIVRNTITKSTPADDSIKQATTLSSSHQATTPHVGGLLHVDMSVVKSNSKHVETFDMVQESWPSMLTSNTSSATPSNSLDGSAPSGSMWSKIVKMPPKPRPKPATEPEIVEEKMEGEDEGEWEEEEEEGEVKKKRKKKKKKNKNKTEKIERTTTLDLSMVLEALQVQYRCACSINSMPYRT